ncbi:MAG: NAD(P)/FAD-dependent oxidoreductase [Deinococcota bacterium]|nr:NAD(P)/FAD-dependent oxidoreductase [Deinococcota bacterium]
MALAGGLRAQPSGGDLCGRTVIWAAGVRDHWPSFAGARRLVGKRLFWCIACDGWRTLGKRILVFADRADCEGTVLQFLSYTRDITVLTQAGSALEALKPALEAEGVPVLTGSVKRVRAEAEAPLAVELANGPKLEADYLFSLLGSTPRVAALAELPLELSPAGHICIDDKNHSSLRDFFAAGDVSDKHSHQVVSAAHEGAMAAQAANHVLYERIKH